MQKAYKPLSAVILCVLMLIFAVSCDKTDDGTFKLSGMTVSNIKIVHVQNSDYNFMLTIRNPASKPAQFDVGKFALLRNSTEDIPLLGGLTECEANKTEQFSIMIDIERPDIAVGDSVTVKYDGKELCKIKITEL